MKAQNPLLPVPVPVLAHPRSQWKGWTHHNLLDVSLGFIARRFPLPPREQLFSGC